MNKNHISTPFPFALRTNDLSLLCSLSFPSIMKFAALRLTYFLPLMINNAAAISRQRCSHLSHSCKFSKEQETCRFIVCIRCVQECMRAKEIRRNDNSCMSTNKRLRQQTSRKTQGVAEM